MGNEESLLSQAGLRYIPNVFMQKPLSDALYMDAEISFNVFATGYYNDWKNTDSDGECKAYRLWARFSGNQFEMRAGLQKINFGSATLFRPLMWFDRIDPRDPLQLTDGVYGLLLRYYFQNNANIWLWGLYGNDDVKGWETMPTENDGFEFGGRVQVPVFTGEVGLTYHHRRADFSRVPQLSLASTKKLVDENRLAFDAKWDVTIGLWLEGALTHLDTDIPLVKYQRMLTIGADYTFDIGNGLHVLAEHFNTENSDNLFSNGEGIRFLGVLMDYPIGLLDRVSAIYYYDRINRDNYFWLNWQRTYDNWLVYLIGFFNPETVRLNQARTGDNAFAGNGFQIMVVFNH